MPDHDTSPAAAGPRKSRRGLRFALIGLFAVFCLAFIFLAALPALLSSGPGVRFLEALAGGRVAGSITMERLSLEWTGRQTVEGLAVKDAGGDEVLAIDRMVNDRSLWSLVRTRGEDLGTTVIKGLRADIVADETGETNLMKALRVPGPAKEKETGLVPVLPFGSLEMGDSQLVVSAPGIEPVVFMVPDLRVDLPAPGKPLRVDLAVETRQGGLTGDLVVHALAENVVDSRRRLQPLAAKVQLEATADNLPVEGLDGAFGFGGVLSGALGRQASLRIRTTADLTKADVDFVFSSPHLETRLRPAFENGILSLTEPGKLDFSVTPAFVASLVKKHAPGSGVALLEPAPLTAVIEELRFPVVPPNLAESSLRFSAQSGKALRFSGLAEGGDLTVKTLAVAADARKPSEKVTVDVSSDLLLGKDPGEVRLTALLSDIFDDRGRFAGAGVKAKIDGRLENVPTAIIDGLAGPPGMVTELAGPFLNAHFSAGNPEKGKTALDLFAESAKFKAETALVVGDRVDVARPVRIQARMTQKLLETLGAGAVAITGSPELALNVNKLSFPLPTEKGVNLREVEFDAVATVGKFDMNPANTGTVNIEGTRLEVKASGLGDVLYTLRTRISPMEGMAATYTGSDPVAVEVSGRTGYTAAKGMSDIAAGISAAGAILNVKTAARIPSGFGKIVMTEPLEVEWNAGAGQTKALFGAKPGSYVPAGPLAVRARVEPTEVPIDGFAPGKIRVTASARLARLELARDGKTEAVVQDVGIQAAFDGPAGRLEGSARAEAAFPGEKGAYPVEVKAALAGMVKNGAFDVGGADLSLDAESRGLPTALAGMFGEGAGKLPLLAGRQADIKARVRKSPLRGGGGEAAIELSAERMKTSAEVTLGETVSLKKPMTFTLRLTPESFASLRGGQGGFVLAEPSDITGTVSELKLPSGKGGGSGGLVLAASLKAPGFVLRQESTKRAVGLRNLVVTAAASPLSDGLAVDVKGAMTDSGSASGALDASARLSGLVGSDGKVNAAGASLKLDARAGKVPVALVDGILGLGGLAEPALGESLDLTALAELKAGEGPLSLNATATHARLDIEGSLGKGEFTLRKPVVGEIDVTEELGKKLLSKIHPIFETVKTAEEPLRVVIDNKGFAVPVKDFDITKVAMPGLKVDSNRMIFRKGGTLEMLILLATQFGGAKGLGSAGEMEVWTTPLLAEMKNGSFTYIRRLDLLIDRKLHAFSWGAVSLAGASSYDLYLGLPAAALRKILGTNRISEGEVFTFPLQGREGKVDTKGTLAKASLDLGRVRGQYELTKKDPLLGIVAGALTKKAIGTDTGPVPPPSVTPLPWAGLLEPEPAPPPPPKQPAADRQPVQSSPSEPAPRPSKPQPEEIIKDVLDLFKK